eukprot:TRINITY_DN1996_c0_g4_i2.p1 TRINITY_DN1996_c0_g4~~TRINITY_DN1996_c0_g4_i2.p1  ORF type:complete len:344 (+),score=32.55 TRINITY_DN1996_c0_g4_i2:77-1108(+)
MCIRDRNCCSFNIKSMLTKIYTAADNLLRRRKLKDSPFSIPNKLRVRKLSANFRLIPYIYNNSRQLQKLSDTTSIALSKTDYSPRADTIGRNFGRVYKHERSIKEKNKKALSNAPLSSKCLSPIKLGLGSRAGVKKLVIQRLRSNTTVRYANASTYKILQSILKREYVFGLKQMEQDYEKSNINNELNNSLMHKQRKVSTTMKLDFMNDSERRKRSVSNMQERKKGFCGKVISDFPLSILRSDYRDKELTRIKSLRRENVDRINKSILEKAGLGNKLSTLDGVNTSTMDQIISRKLHKGKELLKKECCTIYSGTEIRKYTPRLRGSVSTALMCFNCTLLLSAD